MVENREKIEFLRKWRPQNFVKTKGKQKNDNSQQKCETFLMKIKKLSQFLYKSGCRMTKLTVGRRDDESRYL